MQLSLLCLFPNLLHPLLMEWDVRHLAQFTSDLQPSSNLRQGCIELLARQDQ